MTQQLLSRQMRQIHRLTHHSSPGLGPYHIPSRYVNCRCKQPLIALHSTSQPVTHTAQLSSTAWWWQQQPAIFLDAQTFRSVVLPLIHLPAERPSSPAA